MKKIKNFHIKLNKRSIIHNLKVNKQIDEITPETEDLVIKEIERSKEYIHPASVFESFPLDIFESRFVINLQYDIMPVSVSVILATIGTEIEKEFEAVGKKDDNIISKIIHNVALEACEASLNFIFRLISEEAEQEECKVLGLEKIYGEQRKNIITNIEADKISVYMDNKSELHPTYTDMAILKWLPASKRK